ncbi:MAG: HAD family hydrolase [Polyangiales bacterium]
MPIRLLALDLDGTVYRHDGTIAPWDVEAVARARDAGIAVTIATGRIALGTLPAARALGIDLPVVCAEGAVIVHGRTGETIAHRSLPATHVEWLADVAGDHGLAQFWFTHDEIHGEEHGRDHVEYIGTWSPSVTLHPRLESSPAWPLREKVTMAVAVGSHDDVKAAHERVTGAHGERLSAFRFPINSSRTAWTLLVRDAAIDKSTGLAEVAAGLGLDARQVAVVGDWINDVPMFRWARRSFAMGQSPDHVAAHATDRLTATASTGGGVAEAVMKILRDRE